MLKKILLAIGLFVTTSLALYSQGTLTGRIIDADTKEPIMYANVVLLQNGEQKNGAATDINGEFRINNLEGGVYDIQVSYSGYQTTTKSEVEIRATGYSRVGDIGIRNGVDLPPVTIVAEKPIVEASSSSSGKTMSTDEISKMTANSVTELVASTGGVQENADGTSGKMRGESGVTYVGGVARKVDLNVPKEAIGEIKVILGGVPASIGEAMGGATQITLRPPSNQFIGQVAYETSEPFDTRGRHRVDFFLTGPVWKKKLQSGAERTIIGFRFSGYNTYVSDRYRRTSDRYYYMAKDDVVDRLSQSPLIYNPATGSVNYAAAYLTKNDFEQVGRKSNLWSNGLNLDGELNFQLSNTSNLKISGYYSNSIAMNGSIANMYLNNINNSQTSGDLFSVTLDYTQKFLSDNKNKSSLIRDIIFNVVASYMRSYSETYNPEHGDKYFQYGHVGTFKTDKKRTYALTRMTINGIDQWVYEQQAGLLDYEVHYTPSSYNPGLSAYTSQLYFGEDFAALRNATMGSEYAYNLNYTNIRLYKGLVNGDLPGSIYTFPNGTGINNLGIGNSTYTKGETQFIYAAAKVTANIGDEIYPHSLEFGFNYDQSIYRGWSVAATSLWTLMKQLVNTHISALDKTNPIIDESGVIPVVSYNFLYNASAQSYFDIAFRQAHGMDIAGTNIIDIDSYDPSEFSMDMFSPDELFNSGNSYITYYGYDYTGEKKITGKKSLEDFFNNKNRTLGAWQPIVMAGYVQDQFQVRNLIFNVGVRVSRFDANQMVLKDPYLLWNAYTVGDFRSAGLGNLVNDKMGDSYVVYVDNLKGDPKLTTVEIKGYRNGDTWYNVNGEVVSDPYNSSSGISGSEAKPIPYRKVDSDRGYSLNSTGMPVDSKGSVVADADAFKDYEPEIVVEPRIAFSFPATDNSVFKASYDVIARRPDQGTWQANYINYLPDVFLARASSSMFSNPNLNSEKITNYELGFEQALTKTSKVGISAFYKQTRDLINFVQYVGTDPAGLYYSYGNQDFRTIKGATIEYLLRYSKNFQFNINYTLQYAEGTVGLPTNTILGLIRQGYPNIKLMFPTTDDHRHEIKFDAMFSFGSGTDYNGPTTTKKVGEDKVKTIRWFQNSGISLHGVFSSGTPYTRYLSNTQSTIVGSFQGSRLPWWYRLDLTIYKNFDIKVNKKTTALQVYCRVRNLLNSKSIQSVFGVTGDPDDDGYLTDPETQTTILGKENADAYRAYYAMMLNNYYFNYIPPMTIDIGVKYKF